MAFPHPPEDDVQRDVSGLSGTQISCARLTGRKWTKSCMQFPNIHSTRDQQHLEFSFVSWMRGCVATLNVNCLWSIPTAGLVANLIAGTHPNTAWQLMGTGQSSRHRIILNQGFFIPTMAEVSVQRSGHGIQFQWLGVLVIQLTWWVRIVFVFGSWKKHQATRNFQTWSELLTYNPLLAVPPEFCLKESIDLQGPVYLKSWVGACDPAGYLQVMLPCASTNIGSLHHAASTTCFLFFCFFLKGCIGHTLLLVGEIPNFRSTLSKSKFLLIGYDPIIILAGHVPKNPPFLLCPQLFAGLPGVWMQLVLEQFGAIVNNVGNSTETQWPHWEGVINMYWYLRFVNKISRFDDVVPTVKFSLNLLLGSCDPIYSCVHIYI